MKSTFFRFVRHADVLAYLKCGWVVRPALNGTHHGEWSVLMEWLCDCELKQPKHA